VEIIFEKVITDLIDQGYAVCDDFLPTALVEGLRGNLTELCKEGNLRLAGIGKWQHYQKDKAIRNDHIFWIDAQSKDTFEKQFFKTVNDFVDYLNRTCFAGIRSHEFHYAVYPKGAYYKRHLDQFSNDSGRKYTMIFYLNDAWRAEDGGDLALYLKDAERRILPVAGRMVFFESHKIEHEVKMASRTRMSITGWLKNVEAILPVE